MRYHWQGVERRGRGNWYDNFFDGVVPALWSTAFPEPVTRREVDAVEQLFQIDRGVLRTDYTFITRQGRETRRVYHYVYTAAELIEMLKISRFHVEGLYSPPELEPFCLGDPRLLLLAGKES